MSEFWARKIRTYFSKIDVNSDGFISKKDAEAMADNLTDQAKSSPDQRAKTRNHYVELWRAFMKSAGSDDNGLLTASILVASIDQQRNDHEFKDTFVKLCHDFFAVLDVDGDGYLTEDEFSRAFVGILIKDVSFVRTAFESLDVNKDGKLSINEYTAGLLAYLTTEDELLLWGPLV